MRWWLLPVISLALVVVESGRRVTDGGRLQALAAARERQEHLNSTRDARRERTAARRKVDDDSGALRNGPSGGKPPLWGGSAPVFVIQRITPNLFSRKFVFRQKRHDQEVF
eukprot:1160992-Pelagomonas_calceolata.AAC.2